MIRCVSASLLLLVVVGQAWAEQKPGAIEEAALRRAATKACALIEKSQKVWYDKKQVCTSCHHQVLPILVQAAARDRGIAVDAELARDVVARSFTYLKGLDAIVQGQNYIDEVDEAWRLVTAAAAGVPASVSTSAGAQFLASAQRADGSWYTMDARPPQSHGRFTTTALSARAVQLYLPDSFREEKQAVLRRARKWLEEARPRTTEERAFQLLGLYWTGAGKEARDRAARHLLAQQRDDGGWPQLPGMPGDAYSTGEVLYALHRGAGLASDSPVYQRGLRFLLKTQEADGSWLVKSRIDMDLAVSPPYFNAGFPHGRRHQFISIMGTGWAVLALLQAIPEAKKKPAAPAWPDLRPAVKDDWIDVALNGTAGELKKALDGGMKASARTAGGTTALMLAARDPEKVKLLLARGADVNARADSGFTALLIAARYRGNAETVRLLLKKGARPNAPGGVKVLHGASALFFAATSGDLETAGALLDAGAAVDAEMWVLGQLQQTPLMAAALRGDSAMVELLTRRKANASWGDRAGTTVLHRAVINNHPAAVKALLAAGAKIDQADRGGYTALHYAVLVDHADPTVTTLLLGAGANRDLKDTRGRTPLDLARANRRQAIQAVLAGKASPR